MNTKSRIKTNKLANQKVEKEMLLDSDPHLLSAKDSLMLKIMACMPVDRVSIMLINVKMTTIGSILTYINMVSFVPCLDGHQRGLT